VWAADSTSAHRQSGVSGGAGSSDPRSERAKQERSGRPLPPRREIGRDERIQRRISLLHIGPPPVTGIIVEAAPFVLTVRGAGRAEAVRRAGLAPRAGERITAVHVREGDRVREGQILVELDARPLTLSVREAEARLASAELAFSAQIFADSAATRGSASGWPTARVSPRPSSGWNGRVSIWKERGSPLPSPARSWRSRRPSENAPWPTSRS